jgi:hypothetical protein
LNNRYPSNAAERSARPSGRPRPAPRATLCLWQLLAPEALVGVCWVALAVASCVIVLVAVVVVTAASRLRNVALSHANPSPLVQHEVTLSPSPQQIFVSRQGDTSIVLSGLPNSKGQPTHRRRSSPVWCRSRQCVRIAKLYILFRHCAAHPAPTLQL